MRPMRLISILLLVICVYILLQFAPNIESNTVNKPDEIGEIKALGTIYTGEIKVYAHVKYNQPTNVSLMVPELRSLGIDPDDVIDMDINFVYQIGYDLSKVTIRKDTVILPASHIYPIRGEIVRAETSVWWLNQDKIPYYINTMITKELNDPKRMQAVLDKHKKQAFIVAKDAIGRVSNLPVVTL